MNNRNLFSKKSNVVLSAFQATAGSRSRMLKSMKSEIFASPRIAAVCICTLIAIGFGNSLSADEAFEAKVLASKAAASEKFPDLKDPESRLYKLVVEMIPKLKTDDPEMFEEADWPMKVSKYCAKMIRQYDKTQREAQAAANRKSRDQLIAQIAEIEGLMTFYRGDSRAMKSLSTLLDLLRLQLSSLPEDPAADETGGFPGKSIQSRIDGNFNGWEGDTVVKLENGQVWQQVDFKFKFAFKFRPKVLVFRDGGNYYMIIEGVNDKIKVRQIR